jgi:hypothetical protein
LKAGLRPFSFALACIGCGPELERISQVNGLRVLGIQKNLIQKDVNGDEGVAGGGSYAMPGEKVEFSMLWYNGLPDATTGPPVQRVWVGGCVNPLGNRFNECGERLTKKIAAMPPEEFGRQFVRIVVAGSERSSTEQDRVQPFVMPEAAEAFVTADGQKLEKPDEFGQYYAFFAVCAGTLELVTDGTFPPVSCSYQGQPAKPERFVVGYTGVTLTREPVRNENPLIDSSQFYVDLQPVIANCVGTSCLGWKDPPDPEAFCAMDPKLCIPACPADADDEDCPPIPWGPWLRDEDPEFREAGDDRQWLNFHADRGKVQSDVRLVADGNVGWIGDTDPLTQYYAPKQTGWAHLWAVLRDDRGGANWIMVPIWIK